MKTKYIVILTTIMLLISHSFCETHAQISKSWLGKNSGKVTSASNNSWSYTCDDGIEVELLSLGIKNNVPAQIDIPDVENVQRLVVEIVYKGKNPGSTIAIQDADGNSYIATREVPAGGSSNVWYYRTELPATSQVKYINTTNASKAQSLLAYVFRKKNNGIGSSGTFTAIGGYNNIETIKIPVSTDIGPRTINVELPVSELTPDGRYIHIEISAADGSFAELTENINGFPDGQCCIKVFELSLNNVAGNVDEVTIKIDTRNKKNGQSVNGQSWVMGGSVKTDVYCSCINDTTPPQPDASVLSDITGECNVTTLKPPTATDNCTAGTIIGTTNTVLPITASGTTVVIWTFTDAVGNSTTQTQNVIIEDNKAPIPSIVKLPDLEGDCNIEAPTPPTAIDNCSGSITGTTTTSFPITTQGTTEIIWTYTDAAGNSSTQIQNIIIDDTTPPLADAINLPDLTSGCSVPAPAAPTALDNCDGPITGTTTSTFPITTQGTTVVTWTFTDEAGNSSSQTQNVIVNDVTPPTADNLEDHLLLFNFNNLPEVTFSDDCSAVTIEYTEYQAVQSCWADFGPGNATTNMRFENVPFDENHHWEYGYVEMLLNIRPKVHGRVVNNSDPTSGFIVEIIFESITPYVQWIASGGQTPGDALQDQREYAKVDFTQPYTFDGFGAYKNASITLEENNPSSYIEVGAKTELGNYGAAFRLAYNGALSDGSVIGGNGRVIEMFTSLERCVNLRGLLLVREWIVTDAAGNSQVFIQRIETEE